MRRRRVSQGALPRSSRRSRGIRDHWVLFIVQPQVYRVSFLLIAVILTLLRYPAVARLRLSGRGTLYDWILVTLA